MKEPFWPGTLIETCLQRPTQTLFKIQHVYILINVSSVNGCFYQKGALHNVKNIQIKCRWLNGPGANVNEWLWAHGGLSTQYWCIEMLLNNTMKVLLVTSVLNCNNFKLMEWAFCTLGHKFPLKNVSYTMKWV